MAKIKDIRLEKSELRSKFRNLRSSFSKSEKSLRDMQISKRCIDNKQFKDAKTILCFISTPIEIDTSPIINFAFSNNKVVAVPKCTDKNGKMNFYIIKSFEDLKKGFFGLMEPDPEISDELVDYNGSVCILPGFAFDKDGYRIGFGKGYYDRFLQKYSGIKIGLCYNECIAGSIPHGKYDVAADFIITQKYTMTIKK